VRQKTGQDKISYIGHSQGTSQMFSALAEGHGALKDKLDIFIALCPITNLKHASASWFDQHTLLDTVKNTLNFFSIH
jgi:hypothetical protein